MAHRLAHVLIVIVCLSLLLYIVIVIIASLIQAQLLALAIFSARELKPVKHLKLFKICATS